MKKNSANPNTRPTSCVPACRAFLLLPFVFSDGPSTRSILTTRQHETKTTLKKQSCCVSVSEYPGDGYTANVAFQRDLHFDRVLTPNESSAYLACRQQWYDEAARDYPPGSFTLKAYPEYLPFTWPGPFDGGCNVFGYAQCMFCVFAFVEK